MTYARRIAKLAALSFAAAAAQAAPLVWTVDDIGFTDGGTVTGSFTYDADTRSVSDFGFVVSGGDEGNFPAFTFDTTTAAFDQNTFNALGWFVFDQTGSSRELRFDFDAELTNAGGTVALALGSGSVECYNCAPFREMVAGGSTTASIPVEPEPVDTPEPAALALLGLGVLGVAGLRRR